MADFCQQCAIEVFGEDNGDLAGLISEEESRKGFRKLVLCEGCGTCYVDYTGRCTHKYCLKRHGEVNGTQLQTVPRA